MEITVGSYVMYKKDIQDIGRWPDTFGFVTKIKNDRYTVSWKGHCDGIVTSPGIERLVLIYPVTKLTKLLFE